MNKVHGWYSPLNRTQSEVWQLAWIFLQWVKHYTIYLQSFWFSIHISYILQKHEVYLLHIESRSSTRVASKYEFVVECAPGGNLIEVIDGLRDTTAYLNVISRSYENKLGASIFYTPWYNDTIFFIVNNNSSLLCRNFTMVSTKNSGSGSVCKSNSIVRFWTEFWSPWIHRSRIPCS